DARTCRALRGGQGECCARRIETDHTTTIRAEAALTSGAGLNWPGINTVPISRGWGGAGSDQSRSAVTGKNREGVAALGRRICSAKDAIKQQCVVAIRNARRRLRCCSAELYQLRCKTLTVRGAVRDGRGGDRADRSDR